MDRLLARGGAWTGASSANRPAAPRSATSCASGRRGSLGARWHHRHPGHVAYPQLARNPVHQALGALQQLAETTLGRRQRVTSRRRVPDLQRRRRHRRHQRDPGEFRVLFNFRYSTEQTAEGLERAVEALLDAHGLEYRSSGSARGVPFLTGQGALVDAGARALIDTVSGVEPELSTGGGTSDGRFIAPHGIEVVELGRATPRSTRSTSACRSRQADALARDAYERIAELASRTHETQHRTVTLARSIAAARRPGRARRRRSCSSSPSSVVRACWSGARALCPVPLLAVRVLDASGANARLVAPTGRCSATAQPTSSSRSALFGRLAWDSDPPPLSWPRRRRRCTVRRRRPHDARAPPLTPDGHVELRHGRRGPRSDPRPFLRPYAIEPTGTITIEGGSARAQTFEARRLVEADGAGGLVRRRRPLRPRRRQLRGRIPALDGRGAHGRRRASARRHRSRRRRPARDRAPHGRLGGRQRALSFRGPVGAIPGTIRRIRTSPSWRSPRR